MWELQGTEERKYREKQIGRIRKETTRRNYRKADMKKKRKGKKWNIQKTTDGGK